jgi:hypothetical protein
MGSVDASSTLEATGNLARRVAEIERWICAIDTGTGTRGTGTLIGPDLVLTNFHVIEGLLAAPNAAAIARCRFDFKTDPYTEEVFAGRWVGFAPEWCVEKSPPSGADRQGAKTGFKGDELDYAIIRLAERIGEQPVELPGAAKVQARAWLPLPESAELPKPDATVYVFQHPMQLPDKLTGRQEVMPQKCTDGTVIEYLDRDLRMRHRATTFRGSSGSPVFNAKFQLVALHNSGDKTLDIADLGEWNQAIPLPAIVQHLRARGQEALVGKQAPLRQASAPVDVATRAKELTEDAVIQRLWAASILLDRDSVEDRVNWARHNQDGNRGMVHVLACRHVDSHQNFLKRLSVVTIDEQLEAREKRRLAFLGAGTGEPAWRQAALEWQADQDEVVALDLISGKLKEYAGLPGRTLVTATVGVDTIKMARERRVVKAAAALCQKLSDADRLQLFVVYHDPEDKFAARRKELAAMWELGKRPPGCGVCALLDDVGSTELAAWSNALQAAWKVPEARLGAALRTVFGPKPKLPILNIETGLEPGLRQLLGAAE